MRGTGIRGRAQRDACLVALALVSATGGIAVALISRPAASTCRRDRNGCAGMLLGNLSVAPRSVWDPPGRAEAFRFVARRSGPARTVWVYVDRGIRADHALAAVYSAPDHGRRPGSRLTWGEAPTRNTGGWIAVEVGPARLRSHGTYWLALLGTGGAISFRARTGGSCLDASRASAVLSPFVADWRGSRHRNMCAVTAYVTSERPPSPRSRARVGPHAPARTPSPVPPHPSRPPPATLPPAPACTTTLSVGADISGALQAAGAGGVICLPAGTDSGRVEVDLASIHPAANVTLEPSPGATVSLGFLNINSMSNVTIRGFDLPGGVSLRDDASNDVFEGNTISGTRGAGIGFFFYGNGQQQNRIQVIYNQIDHLAPSDLSPPGAGQCMTVYGAEGIEHNFTFSHNVCGPGMANHYTQYGGIDGLTEDYNTFLGPAAPEAIQQNEHNNVLQDFADSDNIDFSHNVIRDTDSRGQDILIQTGHFTNVTVSYNLWVEDPNCRTSSSNCGGYAFAMCAANGLQFNYNTVVDSFAGIQVTYSALTDSNGSPTGCTNQGTGYTVTHNIVVGTADNVDITYGECVSNCTFDYNVTDDGSAAQAASKHSVTNWHPAWTDGTSYLPAGLPFSAGYDP